MRAVTLLPSATEIVYALGVEPVGGSHECDFPPAARDLPAVVDSRVDPDADSRTIDREVRAIERDGEGVYEIDVETLDRLDPDLIVTQGICDVCAVDEVLVERVLGDIDADPAVVTTDPHSVGDVLDDIGRVGAALGREDRAAEIVEGARERIERVRDRVPDGDRPGVAVLDWLDPVMVAGHWVPELVEIAGGEFGLADPGDRSRPREWADLRAYDPEVLVAGPCGFDVDQTARDLDLLTDRPGYEDLAAVPDRAYAMDGTALLNRPGPRLIDTLEALAWIVHPAVFDRPEESLVSPLAGLARV
ncbi:cobalamin-binding protein [Halobacteriales archaeon SW_7_68_16]|nr:MAG: cobalamin-binding protein [Halobacteriales archaeon SW_7_68_16]